MSCLMEENAKCSDDQCPKRSSRNVASRCATGAQGPSSILARNTLSIFFLTAKVPVRRGLASKPLLDWLNTKGMKELQKMRAFTFLSGDSTEVVEFKDGQFTIQCCPNA